MIDICATTCYFHGKNEKKSNMARQAPPPALTRATYIFDDKQYMLKVHLFVCPLKDRRVRDKDTYHCTDPQDL